MNSLGLVRVPGLLSTVVTLLSRLPSCEVMRPRRVHCTGLPQYTQILQGPRQSVSFSVEQIHCHCSSQAVIWQCNGSHILEGLLGCGDCMERRNTPPAWNGLCRDDESCTQRHKISPLCTYINAMMLHTDLLRKQGREGQAQGTCRAVQPCDLFR